MPFNSVGTGVSILSAEEQRYLNATRRTPPVGCRDEDLFYFDIENNPRPRPYAELLELAYRVKIAAAGRATQGYLENARDAVFSQNPNQAERYATHAADSAKKIEQFVKGLRGCKAPASKAREARMQKADAGGLLEVRQSQQISDALKVLNEEAESALREAEKTLETAQAVAEETQLLAEEARRQFPSIFDKFAKLFR